MKCSGNIFGCRSCEYVTVSKTEYLQCNTCRDGLYLLSNDTKNAEFPDQFTFCVADCQLAHYSFVNDPMSGSCKFCGTHCSSCNLKSGCEKCEAPKGWVNAISSMQLSAVNDFHQCQSCTDAKNCEECDPNNPNICLKCLNGPQTLPSCEGPQINPSFDNCLYGVNGHDDQCDKCDDYYNLNTYKFCTSCLQSYCLECTSTQYCQFCAKTSALNLIDPTHQECVDCNPTPQPINLFFKDCEYCTFTKDPQGHVESTTCTACINGYIYDDGTEQRCVSKCPYNSPTLTSGSKGMYGYREFQDRGYLKISECRQCHASCDECMGSGATQCTNCPEGKYLLITEAMKSYGTCETKSSSSATVIIYVETTSNPEKIHYSKVISGQPPSSGILSGYSDLEDALEIAQEFCAPYTLCTVTINLLKGSHYLLRSYRDFYLSTKIQRDTQEMTTTIQPLFCSDANSAQFSSTLCYSDDTDQVTVYNKRRDRFFMKVGGGFTIKNLIFDSLDSYITEEALGETCLESKQQCCSIISGGTDIDCGGALMDRRPTDDCQYTIGGYFIKFDITEKTVLTSPATLLLDNCIFRNFLFEFNSFIDVNFNGGFIEIQDTTFERITSCGAIVRNFREIYSPVELRNSPSAQNAYSYRQNTIPNDIYEELEDLTRLSYNPFAASCGDNILNTCFKITIDGSTFQEFNFMIVKQDYPVFVEYGSGTEYQGRVLNLKAFPGTVQITNSEFLNNLVSYSTCDLLSNLASIVNRHENIYNKNTLQIKNLISVRQNEYSVIIVKNSFAYNSVVKGLIYIENLEGQATSGSKIVIQANSFKYTATFFDASAIFIRSHAPSLKTFIPMSAEDSQPCLGVSVSDNSFEKNFGCPVYGGSLIAFQCVSSLDILDIQGMKLDIVMPDSFDNAPPAIQKTAYYYFNYEEFIAYAKSAENIITVDFKGVTIVLYNEIIMIDGNYINENFCSNGQGLIDFQGVARVILSNGIISNSGDNLVEIINVFWEEFPFIDQPIDATSAYASSYSIINYQTSQKDPVNGGIPFNFYDPDPYQLMKAIVSFQYGGGIIIDSIIFVDCFMFETVLSESRGLIFYGENFYGGIDLSDTIIYQMHGLASAYLYEKLGGVITTLIQYQVTPLFQIDWQSSSLVGFKFTNHIYDITFEKLYSTPENQAVSVIFNIDLTQDNCKMFMVIFGSEASSFSLTYINCISCSNAYSLFSFMTVNLYMMNGSIKEINTGQQNDNNPTLFKISRYTSPEIAPETMEISYVEFEAIKGGLGSIFQLDIQQLNSSLILQYLSFKDVNSDEGGIIALQLSMKGLKIEINDCEFTDIYTESLGGGILYADASQYGLNPQPFIYLSQVTMQNCTIKDIIPAITPENAMYSYQGYALYIMLLQMDEQFNFVIDNVTFNNINLTASNLTNIMDGHYTESIAGKMQNSYIGSLFVLYSAGPVVVTSSNNSFSGVFYSSRGGVFSLSSLLNYVTFTDENSIFSYNVAYQGASVYCLSCKLLKFTNSSFSNNQAKQGAVVSVTMLDDSSDYYNLYKSMANVIGKPPQNKISFISVDILNNYCSQGCAYYQSIGTPEYIDFSDSQISGNIATQDAAMIYIQNTMCSQGGQDLFNLCSESGTLKIDDCTLSSNLAQDNQAGLIYLNSDRIIMNITNSTFTDNYILNKLMTKAANKAGHFYIEKAKEVVIDNCTFNSYSAKVLSLMTNIYNESNGGAPRALFSSRMLQGITAAQEETILQSLMNEVDIPVDLFPIDETDQTSTDSSTPTNQDQPPATQQDDSTIDVSSSLSFNTNYASFGPTAVTQDVTTVATKTQPTSAIYVLIYSVSSGNTTIKNCNHSIFPVWSSSIVNKSLGISMTTKAKYLSYNGYPSFQGVMAFEQEAAIFLTSNRFFYNYATTYGLVKVTKGNLTDKYSNYTNNAGLYGGVYYLKNANAVLKSIRSTKNYAKSGGFIYAVDKVDFQLSDSIILSPFAVIRGGTFTIVLESQTGSQSKSTVTNTTITNTYANYEGGCLLLDNSYADVTFTTTTITNTKAKDKQGGFTVIKSGANLNIIESSIITSKSVDGHIMSVISSSETNVKIQKTYMACTTAKMNEANVLSNIALYATNPYANYGSAFYLKETTLFDSSENQYFNCLYGKEGGVFRVESQTLFKDYFSEFKSKVFLTLMIIDNSAHLGGVMKASASYIHFEKTLFRYNFAYDGGVIKVDNECLLNVTNIRAEYNYAQDNAGVFYILTQSLFLMTDSIALGNHANSGSVISLLQPSKVYMSMISGCQFYDNVAKSDSVLILLQVYQMMIKKSSFVRNRASINSKNVFAGYSSFKMENCHFEDGLDTVSKKAETQGTFIYAIMEVTATITGTTFQNGYSSAGGAFYLSGCKNNMTFNVSLESSISFDTCTFKNNFASKQGGAIYITGFTFVKIAKNCLFIGNDAIGDGGDIYAQYSSKVLFLDSVKISNSLSRNSIYLDQIGFMANNVIITRSRTIAKRTAQGGSIYCYDCSKFIFENGAIHNSIADEGGAIFLTQTPLTKDLQTLTNGYTYYNISSSIFTNSSAQLTHGGALYIQNVKSMKIENCQFTGNFALVRGGAIYTSCTPINKEFNCTLQVQGINKFSNNYVNESGGALFWNDVEPVFISSLSSQVFKNNSGNVYADNIGTFAAKLVMMNESVYKEQMKRAEADKSTLVQEEYRRRVLKSQNNHDGIFEWMHGYYHFDHRGLQSDNSTAATNGTQDGVQSGGGIQAVYIGVADKYGQVVGTAKNSKLTISVDDSYKQNQTAKKYNPGISGTTSYYSEKGVYVVNNLQFSGTPGADYKLKFDSDAIDMDKPSNKEILEQQKNQSASSNSTTSDTTVSFQLSISLRKCEPGEKFTDSGQCVKCTPGTQFSLGNQDQPGDCKKCPTEQAICLGGSKIGPQPGYWRKNNQTATFIKCVNPDSCLGFLAPDYTPQGDCLEGYQGILCSDCIENWSTSGAFQCQKCPEPSTNVVRIVGIMLIVVVIVVFMIRSTLNGASEQRNITSVFQKILLNHIQLVMLTATFDFKWPAMVTSFFAVQQPVGEATSQIFSVDCFINTYSAKNVSLLNSTASVSLNSTDTTENGPPIRIFYFKLLIIVILPLVLTAVSFGFWGIVSLRARAFDLMKTKAISTLVILLFLVHPNIVKQVFQAFYCLDIDGEERLKFDLPVKCYQGSHNFWAYSVAMPGMLAWGFGIPIFALLLLIKEKDRIDKLEVRQRLGFLFRGYKMRFYYWEIVIMFRKIALIVIQSFLVQYGVLLQALVVFVLLICLIVLNMKMSPFQTEVLNSLETMSLLASMITIYGGIFYIVQISQTDIENGTTSAGIQLDETTKVMFFFAILFANLAFIIYWSISMLLEVKNMLIKKMGFLYIMLCLCGNKAKYQHVVNEILVAEENELLRERYMDSLRNLKKLYTDGKMVLSQRTLEKVQYYLTEKKVLKAAGMDPNYIPWKEKEKIDKRNKRQYITQNVNKLIFRQQMMNAAVDEQVDLDHSSQIDESLDPDVVKPMQKMGIGFKTFYHAQHKMEELVVDLSQDEITEHENHSQQNISLRQQESGAPYVQKVQSSIGTEMKAPQKFFDNADDFNHHEVEQSRAPNNHEINFGNNRIDSMESLERQILDLQNDLQFGDGLDKLEDYDEASSRGLDGGLQIGIDGDVKLVGAEAIKAFKLKMIMSKMMDAKTRKDNAKESDIIVKRITKDVQQIRKRKMERLLEEYKEKGYHKLRKQTRAGSEEDEQLNEDSSVQLDAKKKRWEKSKSEKKLKRRVSRPDVTKKVFDAEQDFLRISLDENSPSSKKPQGFDQEIIHKHEEEDISFTPSPNKKSSRFDETRNELKDPIGSSEEDRRGQDDDGLRGSEAKLLKVFNF